MSGYRLTTPAKLDLTDTLEYLLREAGGRIALRYESDFRDSFRLLAANPNLGHIREDLTDYPVFFFAVMPYLIVYEKTADVFTVHAILHGARDVEAALEGRKP